MKTALEDEIDDILRKAYRGMSNEKPFPNSSQIEEIIRKAASMPLSTDEILTVANALNLNQAKLERLANNPYFHQKELPPEWTTIVMPFGPYTVNTHILHDEGRNNCILFDAGTRENEIINHLEANNLDLQKIIITHAHSDHISGLNPLIQKFPQAKIYASDPTIHPKAVQIEEDTKLLFADITIEAVKTPGHSIDGTSFLTTSKNQQVMVVGDAIFARSVGKIPKNYSATLEIIRSKILSLDPQTILLPGHGGNTTVADEREHNPFF